VEQIAMKNHVVRNITIGTLKNVEIVNKDTTSTITAKKPSKHTL
jgi:hypothetical protein